MSSFRSYQYENIPSVHNSSHGQESGPNTGGENSYHSKSRGLGPWPPVEDYPTSSTVLERGRRNPFMIASVFMIFILLLLTHHRNYWEQKQSKGVAGDHGATVATHTNYNPGINSNTTNINRPISTQPKIAYLFTYPSSGASFLIHLFQSITSTNTASTMGSYYVAFEQDASTTTADKGKKVLPSYSESFLPPVSIGFMNTHANESLPLPYWVLNPTSSVMSLRSNSYILTETHCAGACESPSTPEDYFQSIYSFEIACRTIFLKAPPDGMNTSLGVGMQNLQKLGAFDPSLVTRAIHLIRDPWSNIVSRFHAARRNIPITQGNGTTPGLSSDYGNKTGEGVSWLDYHLDSAEGLHKWCREMGTQLPLQFNDTFQYFPFTEEVTTLMQTVPCSLEILKYIQWHNNVEQWIAMYSESPSLVIYFEDLEVVQDRTRIIQDMALFLNMTIKDKSTSKIGNMPVDFFMNRVWYGDQYFNQDERINMEKLVRKLSFPRTMKLLERYFIKR